MKPVEGTYRVIRHARALRNAATETQNMNALGPATDDPEPIADPVPAALDSSNSKLVYFYLHIGGPATIDELQAALGLEKITLYPLLETLIEADLVRRSESRYVCREHPRSEDPQ